MTVAVQGRRIRIARDGVVILDVTQGLFEPVRPAPYLYIQANDATRLVTMRITAIRYYAAPTP